MAIREGRWDCDQCTKKRILGRDMTCPGCGRKRPEGTHFYLVDNEPKVIDRGQIKRAEKGCDWYCERCKSANMADEISCSQCGASKSYLITKTNKDTLPEPYGLYKKILPTLNQPRQKSPIKIVGLTVGSLVFISLILYILWPKEIILEVAGFHWERSVNIEVYKTVLEEDWHLPDGARKLKSWKDIRSYHQVLDHYETRSRLVSETVQNGTEEYNCGSRDLGNGYFEDITCSRPIYETIYRTEIYQEPIYRDEPIYDTRYEFEIDKWLYARTELSKANDRWPYWPEFELKADNRPTGNERQGNRSEIYRVYFTSRDKNQKKYEEEYDINTWKSFKLGGLYSAKLKLNGRLKNLTPLQNSIEK